VEASTTTGFTPRQRRVPRRHCQQPYPGIDRFSRLPTIKPRGERLRRDLIIGVEDHHGRVGRGIRQASHELHFIDLHECSDSVEADTRARVGTRYVAVFVDISGYP
jgi:hypothetical protein